MAWMGKAKVQKMWTILSWTEKWSKTGNPRGAVQLRMEWEEGRRSSSLEYSEL